MTDQKTLNELKKIFEYNYETPEKAKLLANEIKENFLNSLDVAVNEVIKEKDNVYEKNDQSDIDELEIDDPSVLNNISLDQGDSSKIKVHKIPKPVTKKTSPNISLGHAEIEQEDFGIYKMKKDYDGFDDDDIVKQKIFPSPIQENKLEKISKEIFEEYDLLKKIKSINRKNKINSILKFFKLYSLFHFNVKGEQYDVYKNVFERIFLKMNHLEDSDIDRANKVISTLGSIYMEESIDSKKPICYAKPL